MKTLEEKRKAKDREYYEQKKKANVRLCVFGLVQVSHISCCLTETETKGSPRSSAQAGRDQQTAGRNGPCRIQ